MTDRRKQTKQIVVSGRRKTDFGQGERNQYFEDEIQALKKNDDDMKEQMARNHEEIMGILTIQAKTLAPISETYLTASKLGKWVTGMVVFISVIIGIIAGLEKILRK